MNRSRSSFWGSQSPKTKNRSQAVNICSIGRKSIPVNFPHPPLGLASQLPVLQAFPPLQLPVHKLEILTEPLDHCEKFQSSCGDDEDPSIVHCLFQKYTYLPNVSFALVASHLWTLRFHLLCGLLLPYETSYYAKSLQKHMLHVFIYTGRCWFPAISQNRNINLSFLILSFNSNGLGTILIASLFGTTENSNGLCTSSCVVLPSISPEFSQGAQSASDCHKVKTSLF